MLPACDSRTVRFCSAYTALWALYIAHTTPWALYAEYPLHCGILVWQTLW